MKFQIHPHFTLHKTYVLHLALELSHCCFEISMDNVVKLYATLIVKDAGERQRDACVKERKILTEPKS